MDIINDTTKCNEKYHKMVKENRNKIVPKEYDKTYYYDIAKNPQKYFKIYDHDEPEVRKNKKKNVLVLTIAEQQSTKNIVQ